MFKKLHILLAASAILFTFSLALADDAKVADINAAIAKPPEKTPEEPSVEIPDWVKRTNFALEVGSDKKPNYFFETIQPLLGTQDKDLVFFNQSRISQRHSRPAYNTGLGLRKVFKEKYLLGVNSFYDYQEMHKHSRGGVGIEAINDVGLEARVNSYIAISREHLVGEDTNNYYYEKVANGLDWEIGTPLPYLPFLRVYGGGYWYNFDHFKNKYGWKMRMEYNPIKYSRLVFEMFDDTKRSRVGYKFEGALTLGFTSFALKDILNDLKSTKEAYPKVNLRDKVLDRVVRDFDITVISTIKSKGGLSVEGGKSG